MPMKRVAAVALCLLGIAIPVCAQRGGHGGQWPAATVVLQAPPTEASPAGRHSAAVRPEALPPQEAWPRAGLQGRQGLRAVRRAAWFPDIAALQRLPPQSGMRPARNTIAATEVIETAGITGGHTVRPIHRHLVTASTQVWAGTTPTSSTIPMIADTTTRPHTQMTRMP